jgi:acetylornithine/succinyldiaminopimelate/putrescine aminotransferase
VFDYNERGIDELYDTDYPISAVFVEPIQGVSGCVVPPAGMIDHLREFCSYKGALLIVDEIFTGFGRTGEIWASKVQPDILLFGKIAGGGYPLSGLATTKAIADLFEGSSVTTTYGANPVSLAVLSETVDMITDERLLDHVREIGCYMGAHLDNMCQCGYISRLGGAGCMWGFQFENDKQGERAFLELARRGVLTQIEGRVARLCPPMTSRLSVIQKAIEIIEDVIDEDYR